MEIGFVTMFCPFTTAGVKELLVQIAGDTRFVVHCNVKPVASVDHVKITLGPEGITFSRGGLAGNEML
jgi:hypothetical protein